MLSRNGTTFAFMMSEYDKLSFFISLTSEAKLTPFKLSLSYCRPLAMLKFRIRIKLFLNRVHDRMNRVYLHWRKAEAKLLIVASRFTSPAIRNHNNSFI